MPRVTLTPDEERRPPSLLTDAEAQVIILGLAERRGDRGFTEGDGLVLLGWASHTKFMANLLGLVLKGLVRPDVVDGEPVFGLPDPGPEGAGQGGPTP